MIKEELKYIKKKQYLERLFHMTVSFDFVFFLVWFGLLVFFFLSDRLFMKFALLNLSIALGHKISSNTVFRKKHYLNPDQKTKDHLFQEKLNKSNKGSGPHEI